MAIQTPPSALPERRSYELTWRYESRVATQHLGSQKYSTSTRAIGELVANSLDAGASIIDIELVENDLGGVEKVVIADNGCGISPDLSLIHISEPTRQAEISY